MGVTSKLSRYICEEYGIAPNEDLIVEKVRARDLLVYNRIDLIAKMKYIEFREKGHDMCFAKELYTKHIEAFSLGSFAEPGNREKDSIEKYITVFDELIDSMKVNGFDEGVSLIPVGANNTILDGAHRTAIAAYFDLDVSIVQFDEITEDYGPDYFRRRYMDETLIDYLITEYCKLKENVYFACFWPRADVEHKYGQALQVMRDVGTVIYEKDVLLNYEGLHHLITQIYAKDTWIGSIEDGFSGVYQKVDACFRPNAFVRCVLFEAGDLDSVLKMKADIRAIFGIGNHSIHITDCQEETLQICQLLLNEQSVNFLNEGEPFRFREFYREIEKLKQNFIHHDDVLVESESVMGMYGFREPDAIELITAKNGPQHLRYHQNTAENLLYNPSNYFVFNDMKFLTLENLYRFKKNRRESGDEADLMLIKRALRNNRRVKFLKFIVFKRTISRVRLNVKRLIIKLLKKIHIFEQTKKLYIQLRAMRSIRSR